MADFLSELSQSAAVRSLIKATGLPLPIPVELRRLPDGYVARPLVGQSVLLGGSGELGEVIASILSRAGADTAVASEDKIAAFVCDATGLSSPGELRGLYDLLHAAVPRLETCGRIVVLARPPEQATSASMAAARRAVEGCVRSLAKEIGKQGSTANLLIVEAGAEGRIEGALRFFLGAESAFVTAQPLRVSMRTHGEGEVSFVRPLAGKVALVTGAGRGIGEVTAKRLAAEGAHVVCLDRPEDGQLVRAVADSIGGSALLADVCAESAPGEIGRGLMAQHGGVDIVVHNAGITRDKTIARMSPEAWDAVVGVSLGAADRITDALRQGCLRDGGRIICLSSVAGIAGNVGQTNYAAAKAGLIGLVQHLAGELAGRGITVNAVAPGFIETRMTAAIPFMVRETARRLSALGQGGQPEDVAEAITFLATPGAVGITGGVLRVCGGALIGA